MAVSCSQRSTCTICVALDACSLERALFTAGIDWVVNKLTGRISHCINNPFGHFGLRAHHLSIIQHCFRWSYQKIKRKTKIDSSVCDGPDLYSRIIWQCRLIQQRRTQCPILADDAGVRGWESRWNCSVAGGRLDHVCWRHIVPRVQHCKRHPFHWDC